jgi:hypothetical protein
MKIGPFTIGWTRRGHIAAEATNTRKRETFYIGQHSWRDRCEKFNQDYEAHVLAKQAILSIGGQIIAEGGVFLQPVTDKNDKPYARAQDAVSLIEDFNEDIKIKQLLFETGKHMAKYGSYFWEKTVMPEYTLTSIPQQELIEPAAQDENMNITAWRQVENGVEIATWDQDEIIHFPWDVTSQSWPYGTSLLVGLDNEFATLEELSDNARDYMKNQAWPYELHQVGNGEYVPSDTDLSTYRNELRKNKVGSKVVTDMPSEIHIGGTGGSPIRELAEILSFLKDNVQDGLLMPGLSKLYNSTEASAKVVVGWAISALIKPMQEIIAINLKEQVYKPLLEQNGYSVKTCPQIYFEPPDAHKKEEMDFWTGMVNAGICPPIVAAREFGWEDEFKKWDEEKKRLEQEQMMANKAFPPKQGDGKQAQEWFVKKLGST